MTIKELREKYNLTQSALARSLGVSSNAISGIEVGRIKLSPKMSARIKEVYGEEVSHAAFGAEKPSEAATATPEKKTTTKKTRFEKKAAPEKKTTTKKAAPEKSAAHKATPEKPAEAVVIEATAPAAPTPEKNTILEKAAETVAAAPKAEKKPEKKPVPKKAAPKKSTAAKKSEENVPAPPKAEKKTPEAPTVTLQSPLGGEITIDAVKTLVGEVDKVYVRIDQNKLYWVKGEETGDKDIW